MRLAMHRRFLAECHSRRLNRQAMPASSRRAVPKARRAGARSAAKTIWRRRQREGVDRVKQFDRVAFFPQKSTSSIANGSVRGIWREAGQTAPQCLEKLAVSCSAEIDGDQVPVVLQASVQIAWSRWVLPTLVGPDQ